MKDKKAFSALLSDSAQLGEMPRSLYDEALKRIKSASYNKVNDGFAILISASYPEIPRWNMLKRAIIRDIKNDPATVQGIWEKCCDNFGEDNLKVSKVNIFDHYDEDLPENNEHLHTIIVTLKQNDNLFSAPFYSVGHNEKAALSHAKYAFLEHFSFGELQPIEQIAIPNLLYAELESEEESRRDIIEKMVEDAGATLTISINFNKAILEVSGGSFKSTLIIEVEDENTKELELKAFRHLLRDNLFKRTVSQDLQANSIVRPQKLLMELAEKQDYSVIFNSPKEKNKKFEAEIVINRFGQNRSFIKDGPNKYRASLMATVEALKFLGKNLTIGEEEGKGWATDTTRGKNYQFRK